MSERISRRTLGFTLMELTVVMAVLGAIALAATSMLGGRRVVGAIEARQEAQKLAATFRVARNMAVTTGDTIEVAAVRSGRVVTGYRVIPVSRVTELAQPLTRTSPRVQVRWSAPAVRFQPTGTTDRPLQVRLAGEATTWTVDLLAASGQVTISQTP